MTLDYVSLGGTDDTQLDIDAVGFSVIVEYPWYGTEWASVESTSEGFDMPTHQVNLQTVILMISVVILWFVCSDTRSRRNLD